MKPKIITGIMMIILSVILCSGYILFGQNIDEYIKELPQRTARYHNIGEIHISIDEKEMPVNNIPIKFSAETGPIEESEIIDGNFKFKEGVYGMIFFEFQINETDYAPIDVEFCFFNTNWWHVNNYEIYLDLKTNSDGSYIIDTKRIQYNKMYNEVDHVIKNFVIDKNNIKINI